MAYVTEEALADDTGATLVGFKQTLQNSALPGAVHRDVNQKLGEIISITDLGIVADGTNQTIPIIAKLKAAFGASDQVTVIIPANVRWNPQAVLSNTDIKKLERLILLDLGGNNSAHKPGENTKILGLFAPDAAGADEDTYWGVTSGHHPVLMLNNTGTAGSGGAEEGFASLLVARGWFEDGVDENKQFRGAMIAQYRRAFLDHAKWEYVFRSLSPWSAFEPGVRYTRWSAATSYNLTDHIQTNDGLVYECVAAGTSGTTAPSHFSGVEPDGTVAWKFIDSNDRLVFGFDQWGRVKSNGANHSTDLVAWKQATVDDASVAIVRTSGTGASRRVRHIDEPTDAQGFEVPMPYWEANGEPGLGQTLYDPAGNTVLRAAGTGEGVLLFKLRKYGAVAADRATTPSVEHYSTVYLNNSAPTEVTGLSDGSDFQEVTLISLNSGVTKLKHSSSFFLQGSQDLVMSEFDSVTLHKIPGNITNRWIEVGRSKK